jgi:antitoxin (DNA-binding transcriptional repressor) of toxin-antitoxin stability system
MNYATVGEIQKNFAGVLKRIKSGEEITVVKRGKPVAKITALGPKKVVDWPDFYKEAMELSGQSLSDVVIKGRKDRF